MRRPWILHAARAGLCAQGTVYVLVGAFSLAAAVGLRRAPTDSDGALRALARLSGLSALLLPFLAAGLFAYAAWRIVEAVADTEERGRSLSGLSQRTAAVGSACVHLALGTTALALAVGQHPRAGSLRLVAAWVMEHPWGAGVLGVAGLVVAGAGLWQIARAWTGAFLRDLVARRMTVRQRRWVMRIGRLGHAARGFTLLAVAVFLLRAAASGDPRQARDVGQALVALRRAAHGDAVLFLLAGGLGAYGLYGFAQARFRRVPV